MEHVIDASGKSLGRVASEAAQFLRGKRKPGYRPEQLPAVRVRVHNVSKLRMSERKQRDVLQNRYSGYPGGLKQRSLGQRLVRRGHAAVLRQAVLGMLRNNRSRAHIIKQLIVSE